MFNAINLLGTLLQQKSAPSAGQRFGAAFSRDGSPLGGLLSRFGGGADGGALGSVMGALGGRGRDPQADKQRFLEVARQAVSNPRQEIASNNPLAIGGLGALAGSLMGGGRGAVGGGLLAVLGSLAFDALQPRRGGSADPALIESMPVESVPAGNAPFGGASGGYLRPGASPTAEPTQDDIQRSALLVLRSMIQAAKADGQIDAAEIDRITGKIDGSDQAEAAEARAFILEQMRGPPDLASLVREVRSPVEAAEVYGAALLAIEVDTPAERDYLARLARELGLQPDTVTHLHTSLGVPSPP